MPRTISSFRLAWIWRYKRSFGLPEPRGRSAFRTRLRGSLRSFANRLASLRDENCPFETHELRAVGLGPKGPHRDDALPRPRRRFAFLQDLGFGIDRVADEDRRRQLDVIPAEIADRLLAHVADAHADHDR